MILIGWLCGEPALFYRDVDNHRLLPLEWTRTNLLGQVCVKQQPPLRFFTLTSGNQGIGERGGVLYLFQWHAQEPSISPLVKPEQFHTNITWMACVNYIDEACYIQMDQPGHWLAAFTLMCSDTTCTVRHWVLFVEIRAERQMVGAKLFSTNVPIAGLYKLQKQFGLYLADGAWTMDRFCVLMPWEDPCSRHCLFDPLDRDLCTLLLTLLFVDTQLLFQHPWEVFETFFPLTVLQPYYGGYETDETHPYFYLRHLLNVGEQHFTWHAESQNLIYLGSTFYPHVSRVLIGPAKSTDRMRLVGYVNETFGILMCNRTFSKLLAPFRSLRPWPFAKRLSCPTVPLVTPAFPDYQC